jgi:hypothetical protein
MNAITESTSGDGRGVARIDSLFLAAARYRGVAREEIEHVIALIPHAITTSPSFLDRLTGLWRYEFGEPLDLKVAISRSVRTCTIPSITWTTC